ncbi:MAG: hypothetical protein WBA46_09460 [Thermomicrobiales bacterium]
MTNVSHIGHRRRTGPPTDAPPPEEPVYPDPGDPTPIDPRKRYRIDVGFPSIPAMADTAWRALRAANDPPRLFNLGGHCTRVVAHDGPAAAQEMTIDMMMGASARSAYWYKQTREHPMIEALPLERVIRDMLVDANPPLPRLTRITRAPMFGRDGRVSVTPGYDDATGHYFDAGGLTVTPPPDAPTDAEIAGALALLRDDLLHDFPFAGEADFANTLALMLNPFVRDMIEGPTPLHLIEAPVAGTGKGLLAAIAMLPALGTSPTLMPPSTHEEETRKRLMSVAMALPDAVLIDNVAETLDSASLSAMLTAYPTWSDRVLGKSENRTIPITATWIATGNNPSRSREMARRIVTIRLDSQEERPELRRDFKHPRLLRWATRHRAELVAACLTLVRAWVSRGAKPGPVVMGSFDAWAEVHSGIQQMCGVEGFLTNRERADAITVSEDLQWIEFVNRWWARHRDTVVGTADLFPIAQGMPEFPLGTSPHERAQRTVFGMTLKQQVDRIFDGLHITHLGNAHRLAQYQLEWKRTWSPDEERP